MIDRPIIPDLPLIRTRQGGEQRATFFELFFDLVYVFAVTQVSHHLLDDLSWATAAEAAFMLCEIRAVLGLELHDVDDELVRTRTRRRFGSCWCS